MSKFFSILRNLGRTGVKAALFTLIVLILATPAGFANQTALAAPARAHDELVNKCLNANQMQAIQAVDGVSLRFVGSEAGNPIVQPNGIPQTASPEQAARAYLETCGGLLGIKDASSELTTLLSKDIEDGRSMVRFQQKYLGVPVMAGEMIVQMDQQKNILTIMNKTTSIELDSIVPALDAQAASRVALQSVSKEYQLDEGSLSATMPELWVYKPSLLNPADTGPTLLVWRLSVRAQNMPVDELVLINAQRESVALKFNQIDTGFTVDKAAIVRPEGARGTSAPAAAPALGSPAMAIYTMNHSQNDALLPGTFICNQSNSAACNADADAKLALLYSYNTYSYYANKHARDSIDGLGMNIISSVHYGTGYQNAFWDGAQMVYGDGFSTALDVVGHELTHGVTNMESNLFYYYQSGAINESLSDIFGELIEKANMGDTDWSIGENLSIGAIRDMADPTIYYDPDKMSSTYYHTTSDDNGGVHSNSGIINKTAYLMSDGSGGGTFNGYTVRALGLDKVSKIFYEVNSNLLTSGSDFYDLYLALYQGCVNLSLGSSGITSDDCLQVRKAGQATELVSGQPAAGFNPNAPVCAFGQSPSYIFFDGFESGAGNFSASVISGSNPWIVLSGNTYAHTGNNAMEFDNIATASASALRTNNFSLPAGAFLHFDHIFDLETGFDGGVIEYSLNGGGSWVDAGSLIDTVNGKQYTGTLSTISGNPLGGRMAFTGASHGYVQTRLDLSSLGGQTVMFRWVGATDSSTVALAWLLDDIKIYTCHTTTGARFDFNSDGKTDLAVFRPSNGTWYVKNQFNMQYGALGDIPVPGDFNADGKADLALFRPSNGTWYLKDGVKVVYGTNGDIPLNVDFNQDGKTDWALFRPSNGTWYSRGLFSTQYGTNGDIPVPADYNNDGSIDLAVFRPSNGTWYVKGQPSVQYGTNGDIPVPGDYNFDGVTDMAVFRPSNGTWYVKGMSGVQYGLNGDIPVPGDYNGDGKVEMALFRPSNGTWYVKGSSGIIYGVNGDIPLARIK